MQSVNRSRPRNDVALQTELSRQIATRQEQIATGRRIEKPSQNPLAWSQISDVAKLQSNMTAWQRNIDRGLSIAGQAEAALDTIGAQLGRFNELLIQANSDTSSFETRQIIAVEIENIALSITEIINQNNSFSQALFADEEALKIPIDEGVTISVAPSKLAFSDLQNMLNSSAEIVKNGNQATRGALLDSLQIQTDNIAFVLGQQGIASAKVEQAKQHLTDRQIDAAEYRSSLEDADITQSITEMQRLLVNLEAAQATYARIEQSSLFDLIR